MPKQNQIVAVVSALGGRATATFSDFKNLTGKTGLFGGMTRVYEPLEQVQGENAVSLPSESKAVQKFVEQELRLVAEDITRHWDAALTRDAGNMVAKADLKVGDTVLATNIPVPFLLFLGNQLGEIKALVQSLPVHDSSYVWAKDPGNTDGYRTDPVVTLSKETVTVPLVLYPHTDKHPANVTTAEKKNTVGQWLTTQLSGAITEKRKRDLVLRVEELSNAVRTAVEEANSTEVDQKKIGQDVFDWILTPS